MKGVRPLRFGLVLLAGLAAACVSYVVNALVVGLWREDAVRWAVPVAEEASKTGIAVAFGVPLIPVHLAFAVVECVYDLARGTPAGTYGALLSLIGHTVFGVVAYLSIRLAGGVWAGIVGGIIVHTVWNNLAMGRRRNA